MLAGVTDCRRSWKWGCRGRLALGFKPGHSSHTREDHAALVEKGERTRGLWWSRDPVVNTANGAGRLNQGLLLLFLRYGTPDWAEGEGRTVHLWVF